jgi:hypothetical protein
MTPERKHQMWTAAEVARLKKFWPVMSMDGLLIEFAPRSWSSIKNMAYWNGFKRPKHLGGKRKWRRIAAEHQPVFILPTDIPVPHKRPWS